MDDDIQFDIHFECLLKFGMRNTRDFRQSVPKNRHHDKINQRNAPIDPQRHEQSKNNHHRRSETDPDRHLKGLLDIGDISGQPRDEAACGEFVDIFKGKFLNLMKNILPQIFGKPG